MGLSIAISGGIILVTFMVVLYNIPGMLDTILSVADVSSEVFDLEKSIFETNIFIDSLAATSSSPSLTFDLKNVGTEKLWDYDEFDLFVTYDADISGTKTRVTEIIPFGGDLGFSILSEITLTSADTTATSSYTVINGMTDTVTIDGTGSHIIFSTSVTFDSDLSDSGCRAALFIDGSMVAEAQAGVDADSDEPGHIGLVWVETGLSGSHTFDVRWLEEATDCIIATDTQRHMQVVEFTSSDFTISFLANDISTSSDTSITGSYERIDDLWETLTTTAGGVQMIITSVSWIDAGTSDAECDIAIFIDGSMVAETRTATDAVDEGGNASLVWWESGLPAGIHTFEIMARENQADCNTDTQVQRHMQVVEFSGTEVPTTPLEVTGTPSQSFTSSYEVVTGMTITPTIAGKNSLVFISGSVSFVDEFGGDSSCYMGIHRGGTMLTEGQTYQDASNEGRGVSLLWAETGISGSHTYDLRAKEGQTDCAADTSPLIQQHMQVVEFLCPKEWSIASITNDVFDPGMLNTDETAQICVTLSNPIFSNGNVIVSIGTDNGVVTTSALTVA